MGSKVSTTYARIVELVSKVARWNVDEDDDNGDNHDNDDGDYFDGIPNNPTSGVFDPLLYCKSLLKAFKQVFYG